MLPAILYGIMPLPTPMHWLAQVSEGFSKPVYAKKGRRDPYTECQPT